MTRKSTNNEIYQVARSFASKEFKNDVPKEINASTLSYFATLPNQYANEFFDILVNKIVVTRTLHLDRSNDFDIFRKGTQTFGDTQEFIAVDLQPDHNYGDITDPFSAEKPTLKVHYIHTNYKKLWTVKTSYEQVRGAFLNEGGLGDLAAEIQSALLDSRDMFIYDKVVELLKQIPLEQLQSTQKVSLDSITSEGATEVAQKDYEKIYAVSKKMRLPSTKYSQDMIRQKSHVEDLVLILNSAYESSFDVNVMASLFNSGEISKKKIAGNVITIDADLGATGIVGWLVDKECIQLIDRIVTTRAQENAATLELNTFLHNWFKLEYVPIKNMVIFQVA